MFHKLIPSWTILSDSETSISECQFWVLLSGHFSKARTNLIIFSFCVRSIWRMKWSSAIVWLSLQFKPGNSFASLLKHCGETRWYHWGKEYRSGITECYRFGVCGPRSFMNFLKMIFATFSSTIRCTHYKLHHNPHRWRPFIGDSLVETL